MLTGPKKERYQRQTMIEGWNQKRLQESTVFIAGIGGLGCCSSLYLTVAGTGRIRLCDRGIVEMSNLNRQILYTESDIGKPKVKVAQKRLRKINPEVEITTAIGEINEEIIEELADGCDIIIDGLDNQQTRLILNEYSIKKGIPYIYGAVEGWQGFVSVIYPPKTPCLACFFPEIENKNSEPSPVSGAMAAGIGTMQALEAMKYLMRMNETLLGKLLIVNSADLKFEVLEIEKDPDCPVCSRRS